MSRNQEPKQNQQKKKKQQDMAKLSASLKALINAPFARAGPLPAPARVGELFQSIAKDASRRNVGVNSWLAISVGPLPFTLNLGT